MIDIIIHSLVGSSFVRVDVDYRVVSTFYQARSRLVEAVDTGSGGRELGREGRRTLEANYKSCFTAFYK